MRMDEKKDSKNETDTSWWQPNLILFGRLSGWIGGPIILAIFFGKFLDEKYSTEPKWFLICVGVAFIGSTVGIIKDSLEAMEKIEKSELKKKNNLKNKEERSD